MRDIMLRGWDIERPEVLLAIITQPMQNLINLNDQWKESLLQVYLGLISTSLWIGIFLSLSWIVVKIKS